MIRIEAGEPPFLREKLFYLLYSVNFINGLTFFNQDTTYHYYDYYSTSCMVEDLGIKPKGTINLGVIGSLFSLGGG